MRQLNDLAILHKYDLHIYRIETTSVSKLRQLMLHKTSSVQNAYYKTIQNNLICYNTQYKKETQQAS